METKFTLKYFLRDRKRRVTWIQAFVLLWGMRRCTASKVRVSRKAWKIRSIFFPFLRVKSHLLECNSFKMNIWLGVFLRVRVKTHPFVLLIWVNMDILSNFDDSSHFSVLLSRLFRFLAFAMLEQLPHCSDATCRWRWRLFPEPCVFFASWETLPIYCGDTWSIVDTLRMKKTVPFSPWY
jgi:hypothetical protein